MSSDFIIGVSAGDHKLASLLYDKVLALPIFYVKDGSLITYKTPPNDILFEPLSSDFCFPGITTSRDSVYLDDSLGETSIEEFKFVRIIYETHSNTKQIFTMEFFLDFDTYMNDYSMAPKRDRSYGYWTIHANLEVFGVARNLRRRGFNAVPIYHILPSIRIGSSGSQDVFQMKLRNLNLIDTSKIEWDHLMEVRKDKDTIHKIRALKTLIRGYEEKDM